MARVRRVQLEALERLCVRNHVEQEVKVARPLRALGQAAALYAAWRSTGWTGDHAGMLGKDVDRARAWTVGLLCGAQTRAGGFDARGAHVHAVGARERGRRRRRRLLRRARGAAHDAGSQLGRKRCSGIASHHPLELARREARERQAEQRRGVATRCAALQAAQRLRNRHVARGRGHGGVREYMQAHDARHLVDSNAPHKGLERLVVPHAPARFGRC